ncbi:hypothetical protein LSAT2_015343 [Lamellibrachia satsuma]|nr:hypothetical protein LSAT2_015343 [Lamellibrachia satsuma]
MGNVTRDLHRLVVPRNMWVENILRIMWTSVSSSEQSSWWHTNHLVPLLPTDLQTVTPVVIEEDQSVAEQEQLDEEQEEEQGATEGERMDGELGQGETEVSRGGENYESRGGETEESRGGVTEENKESSGNVREKAGKKKKDDRRQRMQQKRSKRVSGEGLPGGKTVKVDDRRERGHTSSVQQEMSFADVVSQRKARKARVFMGDSIIRKVAKIVNRGDDITVCLPGAKVEDIAEKAGHVMGGGTGGAVLLHVGTNNAEKEGTPAIIGKYRRLIMTPKEARVGQIVLSGILPIMGGRGEEYRNCRRLAINTQVQKVCMEEGVGFVDMRLNFVGRGDFFMRDGLHLTGKSAAVLGCEFVRVVDEGTEWKEANITPLFKKGSRKKPENYRPGPPLAVKSRMRTIGKRSKLFARSREDGRHYFLVGCGPDSLYTVVILDRDAPSRQLPLSRYWVHGLFADITSADMASGDITKGSVLKAYNRPSPPRNSGPHSYQILQLRQDPTVGADNMEGLAHLSLTNGGFKAQNFLTTNKMCGEGQLIGTFEFHCSNPDGEDPKNPDRQCPYLPAVAPPATR